MSKKKIQQRFGMKWFFIEENCQKIMTIKHYKKGVKKRNLIPGGHRKRLVTPIFLQRLQLQNA